MLLPEEIVKMYGEFKIHDLVITDRALKTIPQTCAENDTMFYALVNILKNQNLNHPNFQGDIDTLVAEQKKSLIEFCRTRYTERCGPLEAEHAVNALTNVRNMHDSAGWLVLSNLLDSTIHIMSKEGGTGFMRYASAKGCDVSPSSPFNLWFHAHDNLLNGIVITPKFQTDIDNMLPCEYDPDYNAPDPDLMSDYESDDADDDIEMLSDTQTTVSETASTGTKTEALPQMNQDKYILPSVNLASYRGPIITYDTYKKNQAQKTSDTPQPEKPKFVTHADMYDERSFEGRMGPVMPEGFVPAGMVKRPSPTTSNDAVLEARRARLAKNLGLKVNVVTNDMLDIYDDEGKLRPPLETKMIIDQRKREQEAQDRSVPHEFEKVSSNPSVVDKFSNVSSSAWGDTDSDSESSDEDPDEILLRYETCVKERQSWAYDPIPVPVNTIAVTTPLPTVKDAAPKIVMKKATPCVFPPISTKPKMSQLFSASVVSPPIAKTVTPVTPAVKAPVHVAKATPVAPTPVVEKSSSASVGSVEEKKSVAPAAAMVTPVVTPAPISQEKQVKKENAPLTEKDMTNIFISRRSKRSFRRSDGKTSTPVTPVEKPTSPSAPEPAVSVPVCKREPAPTPTPAPASVPTPVVKPAPSPTPVVKPPTPTPGRPVVLPPTPSVKYTAVTIVDKKTGKVITPPEPASTEPTQTDEASSPPAPAPVKEKPASVDQSVQTYSDIRVLTDDAGNKFLEKEPGRIERMYEYADKYQAYEPDFGTVHGCIPKHPVKKIYPFARHFFSDIKFEMSRDYPAQQEFCQKMSEVKRLINEKVKFLNMSFNIRVMFESDYRNSDSEDFRWKIHVGVPQQLSYNAFGARLDDILEIANKHFSSNGLKFCLSTYTKFKSDMPRTPEQEEIVKEDARANNGEYYYAVNEDTGETQRVRHPPRSYETSDDFHKLFEMSKRPGYDGPVRVIGTNLTACEMVVTKRRPDDSRVTVVDVPLTAPPAEPDFKTISCPMRMMRYKERVAAYEKAMAEKALQEASAALSDPPSVAQSPQVPVHAPNVEVRRNGVKAPRVPMQQLQQQCSPDLLPPPAAFSDVHVDTAPRAHAPAPMVHANHAGNVTCIRNPAQQSESVTAPVFQQTHAQQTGPVNVNNVHCAKVAAQPQPQMQGVPQYQSTKRYNRNQTHTVGQRQYNNRNKQRHNRRNQQQNQSMNAFYYQPPYQTNFIQHQIPQNQFNAMYVQ